MTKSSFLRQVGFGLAPRQLQPKVQTWLAVLLMALPCVASIIFIIVVPEDEGEKTAC